jgi:hypothetical protein
MVKERPSSRLVVDRCGGCPAGSHDGHGVGAHDLVFEWLRDDGGDEVILRTEVAVEGAIGQAGVGDQGRDAGTRVRDFDGWLSGEPPTAS